MTKTIILRATSLGELQEKIDEAEKDSEQYTKKVVALGGITKVVKQYVIPLTIKETIKEGCFSPR